MIKSVCHSKITSRENVIGTQKFMNRRPENAAHLYAAVVVIIQPEELIGQYIEEDVLGPGDGLQMIEEYAKLLGEALAEQCIDSYIAILDPDSVIEAHGTYKIAAEFMDEEKVDQIYTQLASDCYLTVFEEVENKLAHKLLS